MKKQSIQELARDWGIDYQAFKIKTGLVKEIQDFCKKNEISQRKLASMVPGLTQDRVSKIFSGQVGTMTIDKMVAILSVLGFQVSIKTMAA